MTEEPTVDQLQRFLQDQLVEAEEISDEIERELRILRLESALFEAIEFNNSVSERELVESILFEESSSVRLISSADSEDVEFESNSDSCPECDEPLYGELDFCQVCGYKKK